MTLSLYLNFFLVQLHSWLLGITAVDLTCLPCSSFLNPSPRNLLGSSPVLLLQCDRDSPLEFSLWWQSGSPRPADRFPPCWQPAPLPLSSKQHLLPDSLSSCHHGVLCWHLPLTLHHLLTTLVTAPAMLIPCNCHSSVWARPFPSALSQPLNWAPWSVDWRLEMKGRMLIPNTHEVFSSITLLNNHKPATFTASGQ